MRMRRSSTIQSVPVKDSCGSRSNTRRIAASTVTCAWFGKRNTTMPGYFAGGYVRILEKSKSKLSAAHIDDAFVWLAAQRLLDHGVSVVPGRFEHRRQ